MPRKRKREKGRKIEREKQKGRGMESFKKCPKHSPPHFHTFRNLFHAKLHIGKWQI